MEADTTPVARARFAISAETFTLLSLTEAEGFNVTGAYHHALQAGHSYVVSLTSTERYFDIELPSPDCFDRFGREPLYETLGDRMHDNALNAF